MSCNPLFIGFLRICDQEEEKAGANNHAIIYQRPTVYRATLLACFHLLTCDGAMRYVLLSFRLTDDETEAQTE